MDKYVKMKKANVRIVFRPKFVKYECPYCGYEHEDNYGEFPLSDELWADWKNNSLL